jgi:hypothetical protein
VEALKAHTQAALRCPGHERAADLVVQATGVDPAQSDRAEVTGTCLPGWRARRTPCRPTVAVEASSGPGAVILVMGGRGQPPNRRTVPIRIGVAWFVA